jgi:DNA-directed RNA polymerase specialized sigma subunit
MSIRKRTTIVEMFSTFLNFIDYQNYPILNWVTNTNLERNIKIIIEQDILSDEEFWARYWLRSLLQNPPLALAKEHLLAYLEDTCYWVAGIVQRKIAIQDFTWMDYWQIARTITANDLLKLLANYNSENSRLKTYAQLRITSAVIDKIRVGREPEKYSDWSWLRSLTKKSLKQALYKANFTDGQQSCYLLAWYCFKEIYTPNKTLPNRKLAPPTSQELEMITAYYNNELQKKSQNISENITVQELQTLLDTCVKVSKENSKLPVVSSLDDANNPLEGLINNLPQEELEPDDSFLALREVLSQAFEALPESNQKMLILEHGLELKQRDIQLVFNFDKQYQVSREIKSLHKFLLKELVKWCSQNIGLTLNTKEIEQKSKEMYQWLAPYCKSQLYQYIQDIVCSDLYDELRLLKLRFGQNLSPNAVALELQINEDEIILKLSRIKQYIQTRLQEKIQNTLSISLVSLTSAEKQIAALVDEWLSTAPYGNFEAQKREEI